MTIGSYTRNIYFIPTILYHNGDGIYAGLELAWFKWYVGFYWTKTKLRQIVKIKKMNTLTNDN